ncbi:MAG TPA: DUF4388 domain-containing protein [Ktedonobacteraceae bacterium]|nr:DUF4388 domain-containing protein [Ktedonobacteraceae bacterium]
MAQQKETITNSLADVIQVLQLSRKSGVLAVERGEGKTFEEGMITFVNGQAVEAQTAAFNGQNALRWLDSWGSCRFAFIPTPTSEIPSVPALVSTPAFAQQMRDTGTHPRIPISPLRESAARRQASNGKTGQVISFIPASVVPHLVIPLEESLRRVDQLGLSRQHRRLLLLVDGRRNVIEMVRLIGRTQYEVQKLLADLEQVEIIRL